jgi:hypothetical protein
MSGVGDVYIVEMVGSPDNGRCLVRLECTVAGVDRGMLANCQSIVGNPAAPECVLQIN